jgi:hypothetical protein
VTRLATRRFGVLGVVVAAVLIVTAACTPSDPEPTATPVPTIEPSPTQTVPAAPALVPDGTATDNLPFFTTIVATVAGTPEAGSGRAYIDALVANGFDKSAMQVTQDSSTVGNPAESIQFSVRWGEECLVGQVGPATGAPVTVVLPGLATGDCLIGSTRAIDW